MTRVLTRKTLSLSAVAVCVGCSLVYDTERLTDGGDAFSKPSGGFSGSAGIGGVPGIAGKNTGGVSASGTSSGGASSSGTSAGGTIAAAAAGGTAGTGQNNGGNAGEATGGADGVAGEPGTDCSQTYYPDEDGDGWGNEALAGVNCARPDYAPGGDCADNDPFNHPGNTEYCDGVENDCDAGTPDLCASDCVVGVYGNHRYLFCVGYSSWPEARTRCAQNGMRLVRIDDAAEQTWVNAWHLQEPPQHSWTGGSDAEEPGTWKWDDGDVLRDQGMNVGYSDWNAGEPNNYGGNEHCLQLANGDWWNDFRCSEPFEFTCERY